MTQTPDSQEVAYKGATYTVTSTYCGEKPLKELQKEILLLAIKTSSKKS